jgi:hypothetical protein
MLSCTGIVLNRVRPVQGLSLMLVEPTEQTLYRRLCGTLARKEIFILEIVVKWIIT